MVQLRHTQLTHTLLHATLEGVQERVLPLSALEWPALVPVEGNALWFRHVALPAARECFYFVCTYRVVCNGEELSVPPWIAA